MIPKSFLQTPDGDLDFSRGLRWTPDLLTYTAQKLTQTLQFWEGEWFLNLRAGLPLLRLVLGHRYDAALVESVYRQAAAKTRGVGSVGSVVSSFDNRTRAVSVTLARVRTVEGEDVPDPGPFIVEPPK